MEQENDILVGLSSEIDKLVAIGVCNTETLDQLRDRFEFSAKPDLVEPAFNAIGRVLPDLLAQPQAIETLSATIELFEFLRVGAEICRRNATPSGDLLDAYCSYAKPAMAIATEIIETDQPDPTQGKLALSLAFHASFALYATDPQSTAVNAECLGRFCDPAFEWAKSLMAENPGDAGLGRPALRLAPTAATYNRSSGDETQSANALSLARYLEPAVSWAHHLTALHPKDAVLGVHAVNVAIHAAYCCHAGQSNTNESRLQALEVYIDPAMEWAKALMTEHPTGPKLGLAALDLAYNAAIDWHEGHRNTPDSRLQDLQRFSDPALTWAKALMAEHPTDAKLGLAALNLAYNAAIYCHEGQGNSPDSRLQSLELYSDPAMEWAKTLLAEHPANKQLGDAALKLALNSAYAYDEGHGNSPDSLRRSLDRYSDPAMAWASELMAEFPTDTNLGGSALQLARNAAVNCHEGQSNLSDSRLQSLQRYSDPAMAWAKTLMAEHPTDPKLGVEALKLAHNAEINCKRGMGDTVEAHRVAVERYGLPAMTWLPVLQAAHPLNREIGEGALKVAYSASNDYVKQNDTTVAQLQALHHFALPVAERASAVEPLVETALGIPGLGWNMQLWAEGPGLVDTRTFCALLTSKWVLAKGRNEKGLCFIREIQSERGDYAPHMLSAMTRYVSLQLPHVESGLLDLQDVHLLLGQYVHAVAPQLAERAHALQGLIELHKRAEYRSWRTLRRNYERHQRTVSDGSNAAWYEGRWWRALGARLPRAWLGSRLDNRQRELLADEEFRALLQVHDPLRDVHRLLTEQGPIVDGIERGEEMLLSMICAMFASSADVSVVGSPGRKQPSDVLSLDDLGVFLTAHVEADTLPWSDAETLAGALSRSATWPSAAYAAGATRRPEWLLHVRKVYGLEWSEYATNELLNIAYNTMLEASLDDDAFERWTESTLVPAWRLLKDRARRQTAWLLAADPVKEVPAAKEILGIGLLDPAGPAMRDVDLDDWPDAFPRMLALTCTGRVMTWLDENLLEAFWLGGAVPDAQTTRLDAWLRQVEVRMIRYLNLDPLPLQQDRVMALLPQALERDLAIRLEASDFDGISQCLEWSRLMVNHLRLEPGQHDAWQEQTNNLLYAAMLSCEQHAGQGGTWPLPHVWIDQLKDLLSSTPAASNLAAQLLPDERLVQWFVDPARTSLTALVLTPESTHWTPMSFDTPWSDWTQLLDERLEFAGKKATKMESPLDVNWLATGTVVEQVLKALCDEVGEGRRLLMVLPGVLAHLPWEALSAHLQLLDIERVDSLTQWVDRVREMPVTLPAASGVVAAVDPPPLPEPGAAPISRDRAATALALQTAVVARHLDVEAEIDDVPSPSAIAHHLRNSQWLHLCAHGAYIAEQPLRTGIFYQTLDHDTLPVWAFGHLEPGADITVVLGVCESAMVGASSHPLQAEVGVGSALKALGVRQVVAALWQVNVLASTYLMDRMYTYLGENDMTLRQALRPGRHPHPHPREAQLLDPAAASHPP